MPEKEERYIFLGFGIRGYRSFTSANTALVGPFGKVHLIAGQNNSGKSALANIAPRILSSLREGGSIEGAQYPLTERDLPQDSQWATDAHAILSLCFSKTHLLSTTENIRRRNTKAKSALEMILTSALVSRENEEACWFDFDIPIRPQAHSRANLLINGQFAKELAEECETNFRDAALEISSSATSDPQRNLDSITKHLLPWDSIPRVIKVEAIRHITSDAESIEREISGGDGLIKELRRLKMPTVKEQFVNIEKWMKFEQFVRDILNDPDAEVTTDAEAKAVLVKSGTPGFLELSDLGTGIEELVMIAAVAACNNNKLILLEEPEIHLHPTLQSKLVQHFLNDKNGNRFLITTHSPSILNTPGVTVTQVSKIRGVSTASQVRGIVDARDILDDIGAKPSDLLQSNYIIWVEGPSDRIYIKYWLSMIEPELNEGTHYSVMMYGGKLLSACGANIPNENDDLISLFRVNTHFCVLMDSDRTKKGARLNDTKLRIRRECEASGNISWVTDGRTIENYVPSETLRSALDILYPNATYDGELDDQYICPLGSNFKGKKYSPNKVKVARKIVEIGYELSPELRKHVESLATAIKAANGL